MKLIFDIIKTGREFPPKKNYHFNQKNGTIGRSEENDWQLVDSQNYISNRHAQVEYKDGMYFIKDLSTNGTFLKHPYKRLPKNIPIKINSTDIFIVGEYEIQARFMDNDYSQSDIVSYKPTNNIIHQEQSGQNISNKLIPDDFLLDDESIMNNSFADEEESFHDNNVMNLFKDEDDVKNHFDDLYDFEKEPFEIENSHNLNTVTNQLEYEHIEIPTLSNIKQEIVDEVKNVEVETVEEVIDEKVEETVIKSFDKTIDSNKSLAILEKKLGIKFSQLDEDETNKKLEELADIIINSLDGVKDALNTKDKIKKDLLIEDANIKDDNPIRMGQYALSILNETSQKDNIKLSEAVKKSFKELNIHNIALHRSSKNLINIAVTKFSPKSLEHHFESTGDLNSLMPKKYQMWDAYINMFKKLNENPDFGINLISKDFTNEYKNVLYTIKLTSL